MEIWTIRNELQATHPSGRIRYISEIQDQIDDGRIKLIPQPEKVDNRTYVEKRQESYNELNQFELMYNDKVNGTDTWVKAIQRIKAQYPKID